jgi:hypothetical protein
MPMLNDGIPGIGEKRLDLEVAIRQLRIDRQLA